MKRSLVMSAIAGALLVLTSAAAWAAPNPNPAAPAHTQTACAAVLGHNPNTGPNGHISSTGAQHFGAVGAAMCGL